MVDTSFIVIAYNILLIIVLFIARSPIESVEQVVVSVRFQLQIGAVVGLNAVLFHDGHCLRRQLLCLDNDA